MLGKYFLAGLAALWATVAQAAPPLSVYGSLPGFERAAISASGEHVAMIATVNGSKKLVIIDAAQKVVRSGELGNTKIRSVTWAGDLAVLVRYSKTVSLGMDFTTDKAELSAVTVVPLDGGKPWSIFQGEELITGGVRGNYGIMQSSGRWFGYFGGITLVRYNRGGDADLTNTEPDLYEVDLQNHKTRLVAHKAQVDDNSVDRDWLVDAAGVVGATLELEHRTGLWTIRNSASKIITRGQDKLGRVSLIGFSPDGAGVVYYMVDQKDQEGHWFSVPLDGGTPQPFLDEQTINESWYDRGHRLIGYQGDESTGANHFFDPHQDKVYKATARAFPGLRMSLMDYNDGFDRLLVTTEGPGDPGTWWTVDIHTGQANIFATSYAIAPADVGAMRMVPYKAADGLAMEGVLTLPPGREAKGLPAVVLPHGGPSAHDVAGFDWIAQGFASRGYAVFQPNFRGSTGYGTAFRLAGHGQWGKKMQTDISDGLAELVRQNIVDPKRVCIVGASYGGYAALAGVTLQQGLYRCAVAVAGVSDVTKMVSQDTQESASDPMMIRILKEQIGDGADLKAVSPARFADKANAPILLIHGKDDTVVRFSQSTNMADALGRAGKPVEFVTLPGEDHWLSKSETRLAMLQAAVEFVEKHNPAGPAK